MTWEDQSSNNVKFVDWGVLKKGHEAEKTIVVKENEFIEGKVDSIRTHEVFGYTFKLVVEGQADPVMLIGNKSLNKQMVLDDREDFVPVEVGNKVRITYNGMYKTESGGKGYSLTVQVDR